MELKAKHRNAQQIPVQTSLPSDLPGVTTRSRRTSVANVLRATDSTSMSPPQHDSFETDNSDAQTVVAAIESSGHRIDSRTRRVLRVNAQSALAAAQVHTGAQAQHSARALNAKAYTVGSHIVFGRGWYAPQTEAGLRLLAHELTHVLQNPPGEAEALAAGGVAMRVAASDGVQESEAQRNAKTLTVEPSRLSGAQSSHGVSVVRRSELDNEAPPSEQTVAVPGAEDLSQQDVDLAEALAAEIDALVANGWDNASRGSGLDAMLLADEVEHALLEVFEQGHSFTKPQLRDNQAPLVQYFIAQKPKLRVRLSVLRHLAGEFNTQRIERYLAIPLAETFRYQVQKVTASGGEGAEAAQSTMWIRYLEDGEVRWTREYQFVGGGYGAGAAPGSMTSDMSWNDFEAFEYWSPEAFVGRTSFVGGGGGFIIGYEVEMATFHGDGSLIPVDADVGGWVLSTPELGGSSVTGWLALTEEGPAPPPPTHQPLPDAPQFVQPTPVHEQRIITFATNKWQLDERAWIELASFVATTRTVFEGGDYQLQIVGQASRAGNATSNQTLSEQRAGAVRQAFSDLGVTLIDAQVTEVGVGERLAQAEGAAASDDSVVYRSVEISLIGNNKRPL